MASQNCLANRPHCAYDPSARAGRSDSRGICRDAGHGLAPAGRCDVMLVRLRNTGDQPATVKPVITIESPSPMTSIEHAQQVKIGDATRVIFSRPITAAERDGGKRMLRMGSVFLPARGEQSLAVSITRGKVPALAQRT